MEEERKLLSTKEAATILGVGRSTLEQDRVYGRLKIPFVKLGRSVRYKFSDIENYIQSLKAFTSTSATDAGEQS